MLLNENTAGLKIPVNPGFLDFPEDILLQIIEFQFDLIGEFHGSNEIPRLFGELVNRIAKLTNGAAVALEMPVFNQSGLDEYVSTLDERILREIPQFRHASNDGRASDAMFSVIMEVARIPNVKLFAFDAPAESWLSPDEQGRDDAMAKNLLAARKIVGAVPMLVLCGNLHSCKSRGSFFDPGFRSMAWTLDDAAVLQSEKCFSILVNFDRGQTWSQSDEKCIPPGCPSSWRDLEGSNFLFGEAATKSGHDAILFIPELTASPPYCRQSVI